MNILLIGKFSPDQFGFHISDTLKDMGHTTIEFDPTLKYRYSRTTLGRRLHQLNHFVKINLLNTQYFRERRKRKLSVILNSIKIDLTITTHDFLYPDEVDFIKTKTKSPVVMWFPDGIGSASKALFMIADYDLVFFQDPYAVTILNTQYNKKNVFYLPECCNPKYHRTISLSENDLEKYSCDISTYGNPHSYRSFIIAQLADLNLNVKVWGHQPPIWQNDEKIKRLFKGEYLINDEKAKSVLAAKININTLVPAGVYGLNSRTFEIAGIGGFQLIHWRSGLSKLFSDGKELVSFNNFSDLKEKIDFFLFNDDMRFEIATAGQKKAYNAHTYIHRLKLLFDTMFGNSKGFEL